MEELKKLEEAQRTIMLMHSKGFMSSSNNNLDSDRFLSNFILLLIQPCGGLDMEKKCQLIYANLPKISAVFAEEAMPCLSEEGSFLRLYEGKCENNEDFGVLQNDYEDMAMVGLGAMQDANSTLEDFVSSASHLQTDLLVDRTVSLRRKGGIN